MAYQISDKTAPIIIFVGPSQAGKSMVLVRIAKYLYTKGYSVQACRNYIDTNDYQQACDEFDAALTSNQALPGTVTDLLVQIRKTNGDIVAQMLEAPGEHFFNPANPQQAVPGYLQHICGGAVQNKKCFIHILDFDSNPKSPEQSLRNNSTIRDLYAKRLINVIKPFARKIDRHILLYNKIDLTPYGTTHECKNFGGALRDAEQNYSYVFANMKKKILGGLFTVDDFVFLPFSTGTYSENYDDMGDILSKDYNISSDIYPEKLWNEITRRF
ncbi:MAG: hypothetical protein IJR13_03820 [Bacteroidales bacterium]|nr:hypothetical protein [Bacteroidales bacterium]